MYKYEDLKPELFKEENQEMFLKIRDKVKYLLKLSGALSMGHAIEGSLGDSWTQMACVDRLVELEEIREITKKGEVAGQFRIFVSTKN